MKSFYILIVCILCCYPWRSDGARYVGRNPSDAGRLIDRSQGKRGFGFNNPAHPRQHSSTPNAPPNFPCVENYSRQTRQTKSGFDSRRIQNELAHRILSHNKVQAAMGILNQYNGRDKKEIQYKRQVVTLTSSDLNLPSTRLTGGKWTNGIKAESFQIRGAVIVLQHFRGKEKTPRADVHIQTLYPN